MSSIYVWNIFDYGNLDCDLRLNINKTSYSIEKSSRNVNCINLSSTEDPLYDYNLLEFNNFVNYWNGEYFNGLPSFSLSTITTNTPTTSTTTTLPGSERNSCCLNTSIGHSVDVTRSGNSVFGQINGYSFNMSRSTTGLSSVENYSGEITLLGVDGKTYVKYTFEYSGSIGTSNISASASSSSIIGDGRQDPIDINIFGESYSGNTPAEGLIILLIDYFYGD